MNLPITRADEIFVREYLATGEVLVSCMRAGIRIPGMSMSESARATLERPDIQAAIRKAKLEKKYSQPIEWTNRSLAEDYEHIYDEAMAGSEKYGPDLKAAIMAKEAQAKVLGLLVSKLEITKTKDVDEMTTQELEKWLRDHQRSIEGESQRVIDVEEQEHGLSDGGRSEHGD